MIDKYAFQKKRGKLAFLDRGTLLFFHSGSTPRVFFPDCRFKFALDFKFAAWDRVPRLQRPTAAGHSRPARSVHLPSCVRRPIGGMMDRMVPWVSGQGCQRSVGTWVNRQPRVPVLALRWNPKSVCVTDNCYASCITGLSTCTQRYEFGLWFCVTFFGVSRRYPAA